MLPPGACDCHTHVVGDTAHYPMEADRHYTPAAAPHGVLLAHLAAQGLERVVIVQPSFYGTDNRCMLDSLARLEGQGRGVAVVAPDVEQATLRQLHAAGVRGLRINVESFGVRDPVAVANALRALAERIAELNWHIQIYAAMETTAAVAEHLDRLPVPVVLDHFAMVPSSTPFDDAPARALLTLLAGGNAYVKLSASYRVHENDDARSAASVAAWAQAFLAAAPHKVLWGSDWPHTNREPGKGPLEVSRYRSLPSGKLLTEIEAWFPTAAIRQQVLVENATRLYDF
ncbi:amidohydrolase family protein [Ottowia thiooxydans]|uniref:amidohydrolase family protein n=1 Tax=Ottowia thiooxydans TaxID=219182 RepID=UPI00056430D7|nr:amidohydrolase family protein [Ottowia thiooxydans]